MNKTMFQNIIIIGYGKIVGEILKIVDASKTDYGYTVIYVEHEIYWHFVTAKVDAGSIITQKRHIINDNEKAYELVDCLMGLAAETFREFFPNLLESTLQAKSQEFRGKREIYRACEIPGNAEFSLDDHPVDIYRLLRALDYGKAGIFPAATTMLHDKKTKVVRYKKGPATDMGGKPGFLFLPLDDGFLKLI